MAAKYVSSTKTTNFARLSRLVIDVCSDALREVLNAAIPPPGLHAFLMSQRVHLSRNLEPRQQQLLYPPGGVFTGTLEDLDFTLLYRLIRNLQGIGILPHMKGWGRTPDNTDRCLAANIDRLRIQRNEAYGHLSRASLSDADFHRIWGIIRQCIFEIEQGSLTGDTYVTAVDNLLTVTMDPDTENEYIEKLRKQQEDFEAIIEDMKDKHETMTTGISDVTSRVETMATGIRDVTSRVETMATGIRDVTSRVESTKSDISDVFSRVESITTGLTGVIERQETMAVDISDVNTRQETIARDIDIIKDCHPKVAALIKTTRAMIKEEVKKGFIATKGYNDAREKLRMNRIVVIKGNTGDGKTSTAIQLLHWLVEEQQDRQTVQLHNIEDLDLLAPNSIEPIFIDDIFGEKDLREKDVQEWNKRIKSLIPKIAGSDQTQANFLVITVRNEVFNSLNKWSLEGVFTDKNIIDLSSSTYKVQEEKVELLKFYEPEDFSWTEPEKKRIVRFAPDIGFPQCCRLFRDIPNLHSEREKFFERPFKFLTEALSKIGYCPALLFLFLNDGQIRIKHLDPNGDKVNKTLLEEAFDVNLVDGEDCRTTMSYKKKVGFVKESFDKLLGCLVKKLYDISYTRSENGVYIFCHYSIYATVALLYGNKTPVGYIKHCPIDSLSYITTFKASTNMVVISSDHYEYMCERLLRGIIRSDAMIGSLDVWKDRVFFETFVRLLDEMKIDKHKIFNKVCQSGAVEYALYLLNEGVKADRDTPWWLLITRGEFWGKGDVDVLKKAFRYLNDEIKLELFEQACDSGSEECALYLLCEGVKPDHDTDWWSLITGRDDTDIKRDVKVLKKVFIYLDDEVKLDLLNRACRYGSEEFALYLLRKGVNPDKDTPYRSVEGNCVNVLKKIMNDMNDETKTDLLKKACSSYSLECALYLLNEGVTPDKEMKIFFVIGRHVNVLKRVIKYLNDELKLVLLNALCSHGSDECALYLLCEGVKPDENTPVCAMKGNCMNVLKKMLSSLNDGTKLSLLNEACVCLNAECVLYFLCEGVKPDKDTSWWPLIKLCVNIKTDSVVLKIFLTFMNDEIKLDLLKNACIYGDEKCVTYLLCEGVKPDKGTSWMMWEMCMRKGNSGLNLLKKIFIYLNDEVKLEMLNSACKLGSEDFALYLLCAGVKPDKNTPLCVAEGGSVTLLIEIGLNDEIKSNVLSTACYSGSVECALYLLCEGVQPHKDTPWWSLITGGGRHVKADVDVLKKVLRYMTVEIKLNILNKTCDTGSKELALYLLREGVEPKKVTPLRSLITSDVNHGKGDVNVLKKVVQYLNDDIALDLLNKACDSGSEECALYLLSGNVKPDKHTPFCVAKGGSLNVLKKVLDNVNDDIKLPLLKIACRCASKECVIYLLSQGVKPDIDTPFTSLIYRDPLSKECLDLLKTIVIYLNDEMKLQLLNDACYHSEKCALYLLDEGVKPDKNTPFHAAKGGCLNLLKICVKGLKSEIKLAVLNETCSSGATDCVFYLLSEGVKPDQHTPWWSLFAKCHWNDKRNLDVLVNILMYLNENMKMALLNTFCCSGSGECALYLLGEGVKPDKDTPLWSLITRGDHVKGDVDVLKKVVRYVNDSYMNDEIKCDLLNKACRSVSIECALHLLGEGVKPDKDTPLWSLISRGIRCYVDIELLKNVFIYFDDEIKVDLLHKACHSGSTEWFFYLLRQGVEPDNTFPFWSLITSGREGVKGDVDILQKVAIYLNDRVKQDCLNKACRSGSVECALYLLCEGVQTDKDTDWWSLITRGRLYNVDMDLLKEVAIYLDDELKLGLLNKACHRGSEECALYFLRQGIKPDMDTDWWSLISRRMCPNGGVDVLRSVVIFLNNETKLALFNTACSFGSKECALYLLNEGVKPDQYTPICVVHRRSLDLLKRLMIYLDDEKKIVALNTACCLGSEECALFLLSNGVQPDKDTPSCVVEGKSVNLLKRFVNDMDDETKHELLNKACHFESIECAIHLVREGVKPDKDTPLWSLIKKCDVTENVDILQNIVMYCNDEMKLYLLKEACEAVSVEFALYLLCQGVKPDEDTPLWILIYRRSQESKGDVDVLKKVVRYINDEEKQKLLNEACLFGSIEHVLYLLCEGVTPDKGTQWLSLITRSERKMDTLEKVFTYLNDEIKLTLLNKAFGSFWEDWENCALYLLREGVKPEKSSPLWLFIKKCYFDFGKGDVNELQKVFMYCNDEIKLDLLNKSCDSCSEECALYLLCEGVKPNKDTQLWSLITRRVRRGKGFVSILKKVIIYLSDEIKLDLLYKSCDSGSEECAIYILCEGVKPDKDTPWWSLITGGDWYCKGDVDVLKKVVIYLDSEIKLDLLKRARDSESEECVLYLEHECAAVSTSI